MMTVVVVRWSGVLMFSVRRRGVGGGDTFVYVRTSLGAAGVAGAAEVALVVGMAWDAPYQRWATFPQSARNATGHLQRKENEVSGLLKIHSVASAMQTSGLPVDWAHIRRMVLRTRPPYEHYVDSLCTFVAARSAIDGSHLQYLKAFHNSLVNPSVRSAITQFLYPVLADSSFHFVALAVWQAAYSCPPEHVRNSVCCWISGADASTLFKGKSAALQLAETALASWRTGRGEAGFPHPVHEVNELLAVYAKGDIAMARLLLKKQEVSVNQFADVPAVHRYFVGLLKETFPKAKVDHFWTDELPEHPVGADPALGAAAAAAPAKASVAAKALAIHDIGADGSAIGLGLLRQRGFDVGTIVCRKGVPGHWAITSATERLVLLGGLGDLKGENTSVDTNEFVDTYVTAKAGDVEERFSSWSSRRVFAVRDARLLASKALVLSCLNLGADQADARQPLADRIEVFLKPSRKVKALVDLPAGSVILTPDTVNIKVADRTGGPPRCGYTADGGLHALLKHRTGDGSLEEVWTSHDFALLAATSEKAMAPLWFVAASSDRKVVNLQWEWLTVSSVSGSEWEEVTALPPAKAAKTRATKKKKDSAPAVEEEPTVNTVVLLPVLTNPRPISKGSDLICFKPPAEAKPRQVAAIAVSKLSKT